MDVWAARGGAGAGVDGVGLAVVAGGEALVVAEFVVAAPAGVEGVAAGGRSPRSRADFSGGSFGVCGRTEAARPTDAVSGAAEA